MHAHEHTANREPAAKPARRELAKDADSDRPAHHDKHAHMVGGVLS